MGRPPNQSSDQPPVRKGYVPSNLTVKGFRLSRREALVLERLAELRGQGSRNPINLSDVFPLDTNATDQARLSQQIARRLEQLGILAAWGIELEG